LLLGEQEIFSGFPCWSIALLAILSNQKNLQPSGEKSLAFFNNFQYICSRAANC
jgi:hypothetical protein